MSDQELPDDKPIVEVVASDLRDDLDVINGMTNRTAVQMNIDWIRQNSGGAPVVMGLVLLDLLPLFEERVARLNGLRN